MMLFCVFSYSCMNCMRCLESIMKLDKAYRKYGLNAVLVHPSEWEFEKSKENIAMAAKDLGISLQQIALLKKLKVKQVWVKEGIPFVPSFFFAYILTLWKSAWFLSWFF